MNWKTSNSSFSWKIFLEYSHSEKGAGGLGFFTLDLEVRGDTTFSDGLTTPHQPGLFSKASSQVVTPAPTRTDLLDLCSSGFTLDVDMIDGAPWTPKLSCRVPSSQHARAAGAHSSFVGIGG